MTDPSAFVFLACSGVIAAAGQAFFGARAWRLATKDASKIFSLSLAGFFIASILVALASILAFAIRYLLVERSNRPLNEIVIIINAYVQVCPPL